MYTVNEVSQITGVSVRTLHHYDAIGLLPPAQVTLAGYRLYDHETLMRLQSILLFRELRFPLKEIKTMLDSPNFDLHKALRQQIALLEKEREHLEKLIVRACTIEKEGAEKYMFDALDRKEMENYREEAFEKWGKTAAWQEYASRKVTPDQHRQAAETMMAMFGEMGELKDRQPEEAEVQEKIKALQQFITDNFYTCTKEILSNLGLMYTQYDRFRQSIDSVGGEGTAAFVQKAIEIYCR
ncbi:MAG: MerR family transcriptional regulator [Clostridia bacterium]|nr:MerR family transcriptional regulator [Clostridia bacterium]